MSEKRRFNIGVVTVLFKSNGVIEGFVESMNSQTFLDFEVLFVENDSQDHYCEEFINNNAKFSYRFIRNEGNLGVAKGNNQGIDYFLSKDEFSHVLFLNNDIEVDPTFLKSHCDLIDAHPEIEALAPKMFYYNSGGKVWYAGGAISYLKGGCRHFGHNKKDKLVGKPLYRVDYAPTCSLLIDAEILRKSKVRMWEELFVYYDDTVFCHELSKAGVQMFYTPSIHLQHKISSSTGGSASDFSRYYLTRNWLYWGIREKNLAVFFAACLKFIFYALTNKKIEIRAMKDALFLKPASSVEG